MDTDDPLYENAIESAADTPDERVYRLPWQAATIAKMSSGVRRVLKLHGCVSDPRSIVLTRRDYMRYEDERRALRGVLHQNFLEREFLILGFSMTDDNVHVIIDDVRKAMMGKDTREFRMGTVVTLVENEMFRKLWEKDFRVLACGASWDDNPAWLHDIFLDCVASGLVINRASSSFVLNPSYSSLLSQAQQRIRAALGPIHSLMRDRLVKNCPSWHKIEALLRDFGAPELRKDNEERYD